MTNRNSAQKTKCGALRHKASLRPYLRHCRAVTMSWLSLLLPCMGVIGVLGLLGCSGGGNSDVAVTGVSLNKTTLWLRTNAQETLTANVQPGNATNKDVAWTSSDSGIATVSYGTVRAIANGTATITATASEGGKSASCAVTVSEYDPVRKLPERESLID